MENGLERMVMLTHSGQPIRLSLSKLVSPAKMMAAFS